MKLQLTIDHGKDFEVIALVEKLSPVVDVVEIGYPMLLTFGLEYVRGIRERFPDVELCLDAKVFHGGTGITRRCFECGADTVSVLGVAPDPVISKMVEKAHGYGGKVMCDMAGMRNIAQRTAEVDELGVDIVDVPSGFRPEYDYDIESHRGTIRAWFNRVNPLDLAKAAQRNLRHAQLAVSTGINESNIREVVALGPELVLVGRGILDNEDRVAAAERLKRYLPFEG